MKRLIQILAVILLILLVAAMLINFGVFDGKKEEPTTQSTTEAETDESTTQAPTEPPTEPQPVLEECGERYVLNGTELTVYTLDGTAVTPADELIQAAGLDYDGAASKEDKALAEIADSGLSAVIGGKTYDTVADDRLYLPLAEVMETFGYPAYELDGVTYYTPAARRFEIPEDVNVPVLMYHAVSDDMWGINELFVSPDSMDEQLAYLAENGYETIWFEDLAHIEDYEKPVILTFDDGYDDNYLELLPLLRKYQAKATVFVIGNALGMQHKMTEEQVREMADSGLVSIQSHGYTHGDMDAMDADTLDYELDESKKVITRVTGREPYVLCYPTGKYSSTTLEIAPKYYAFGIKMVGGLYNTSDDPFLVNRYYVSRYTDIYTFASYLTAAGT